ncbi:hypothetical protein B0H17DRAFT_1155577 [Mycena rosella]|uniref:Small ribosomal subunit protein mS38 n=1 Tax=Mycena rosella TaxID=1033263 RepID=A0AAD7MBL4_MYCRO|nr:hypothetical protein B0H17DRAFT_1155577 [Mycena rosella]
MSAFARFLHPIPAARRSYSSFFSKPGGGRYFNSHKPAKPVVAAAVTKDSPSAVPPAAADAPAAPSSPASGSSQTSAELPSPAASSSSSAPSVASPRSSTLVPLAASAVRHPHGLPTHPVVAPKDLQLLQFFALHRPLLLLPDPPAVFRSPPPATPLFQPPRPDAAAGAPAPDEAVDDAVVPGDADAEAARQLTRALTMTRAGATVAWDNTLRRLGLDVDLAARDLQAAEWDQDWEDILADSVKRKRRKKMKKHKLRKRRKLTRASRIKLR